MGLLPPQCLEQGVQVWIIISFRLSLHPSPPLLLHWTFVLGPFPPTYLQVYKPSVLTGRLNIRFLPQVHGKMESTVVFTVSAHRMAIGPNCMPRVGVLTTSYEEQQRLGCSFPSFHRNVVFLEHSPVSPSSLDSSSGRPLKLQLAP